MSSQSASEAVITFANNKRANGVEQLEAAGQSIVQLLHKAAGVAEANSRHALDMAQKLSISFARRRPDPQLVRPRLRSIGEKRAR